MGSDIPRRRVLFKILLILYLPLFSKSSSLFGMEYFSPCRPILSSSHLVYLLYIAHSNCRCFCFQFKDACRDTSTTGCSPIVLMSSKGKGDSHSLDPTVYNLKKIFERHSIANILKCYSYNRILIIIIIST